MWGKEIAYFIIFIFILALKNVFVASYPLISTDESIMATTEFDGKISNIEDRSRKYSRY